MIRGNQATSFSGEPVGDKPSSARPRDVCGGGVGTIQELSAGGQGKRLSKAAPCACFLSLPRWKHSHSLTGEYLQRDLIKMETVGMECWGGGGFLDSQQLLGSSLGPIITSASRPAAGSSTEVPMT